MSKSLFQGSEKTHNFYCALLTLTFLVSLSYSMDFGLLDSLKVGLFLLFSSICGAILYISLSRRSSFLFVEIAGMGFAFGSAVPGLMNLIFRSAGITPTYSGLAFPFVALVTGFISLKIKPSSKIRIQPIPTRDLIFILFSSQLAIFPWNQTLWMSSILVGSVLAIQFVNPTKTNYFFWQPKIARHFPVALLFLLPIFGVLNSLFVNGSDSKPIWRGQLGVDTAFDDAQSFGVAKYGLGDNVFQANNPTKGHILTHAWAGDVAEMLSLPRFQITGTFGFAIGIIALSLIIYTIALRNFNSLRVAQLALLIVFVQASLPEPYLAVLSPRMANSISILWLFAFLYLFLEYRNKYLKSPTLILIIGISILTLSKFHWGLISAGSLSVLLLIDFIKTKVIKALLLAILISTSFLLTYMTLLIGMDAYDTTFFAFQIGMLPLIISLVAMRFHLALFEFGRIKTNDYQMICLIQLGLTLPLLWITNGANQTTYFIATTLISFSILIAVVLDKTIFESNSLKPVIPVFFLGLLLGLLTAIFYLYANYRLVGNSHHSQARFLIVDRPELLQLLVTISTLIFYRVTTLIVRRLNLFRNSSFKLPLILFATVLMIGSNFGTWFVSSYRPAVLAIWYDIADSPDYVFNDEQFEVAQWIDTNTPASSIIAANTLCLKFISDNERTPSIEISPDCKNRNMLAWISSLSHRRMFLEAPLTSLMGAGSDLTNEEIKIYNSVLRFGLSGDPQSEYFLKNMGVNYFVVENSQSEITDLDQKFNVVFFNSRYSILKLDVS